MGFPIEEGNRRPICSEEGSLPCIGGERVRFVAGKTRKGLGKEGDRRIGGGGPYIAEPATKERGMGKPPSQQSKKGKGSRFARKKKKCCAPGEGLARIITRNKRSSPKIDIDGGKGGGFWKRKKKRHFIHRSQGGAGLRCAFSYPREGKRGGKPLGNAGGGRGGEGVRDRREEKKRRPTLSQQKDLTAQGR